MIFLFSILLSGSKCVLNCLLPEGAVLCIVGFLVASWSLLTRCPQNSLFAPTPPSCDSQKYLQTVLKYGEQNLVHLRITAIDFVFPFQHFIQIESHKILYLCLLSLSIMVLRFIQFVTCTTWLYHFTKQDSSVDNYNLVKHHFLFVFS